MESILETDKAKNYALDFRENLDNECSSNEEDTSRVSIKCIQNSTSYVKIVIFIGVSIYINSRVQKSSKYKLCAVTNIYCKQQSKKECLILKTLLKRASS